MEEKVNILRLLIEIRDGDEGEVKYCHRHYSNTSSSGPILQREPCKLSIQSKVNIHWQLPGLISRCDHENFVWQDRIQRIFNSTLNIMDNKWIIFYEITGAGFSFSMLRLFMGKMVRQKQPLPSQNLTLTMFARFNLALMGELVHSSYNFVMFEENSINECQRESKLRLGFEVPEIFKV